MPLLETKGAASAQGFGLTLQQAAPVYIESVFQTWLYTGNSSTQTITNGIDLSTKGGLVWIKRRDSSNGNRLNDTARGVETSLSTNNTLGNNTGETTGLTAFSASGFTVSSDPNYNTSAGTYASWTFRKQPKFFDVVTYTGDGSSTTNIPHSLGSAPGCVICKSTSTTEAWGVWHRGDGTTSYGSFGLNSSAGASSLSGFNSHFTSTTFRPNSVRNATAPCNQVGVTYVAYLFAHNAGGFGLTGTDNVISCGSWTGNGSTSGPTVTLGYEPQYILWKRADSIGDWSIIDSMRGSGMTGSPQPILFPNGSSAEGATAGTGTFDFSATGFQIRSTALGVNASGGTYIYIAIRRGPMKTPTSGTSVFAPDIGNSVSGSGDAFTSGFPIDAVLRTRRSDGINLTYSRLTGTEFLRTYATDAGTADAGNPSFASMTGFRWPSTSDFTGWIGWMFRRAPGFFDVVCYTGTGSATTQAHNLGVVPEMIIIKDRISATNWTVYTATTGTGKGIYLNSTSAEVTFSQWVTSTSSTTFGLGTGTNVNGSGDTYVAYLFASCPGVSKVGSYTGTGALQTINCGFTGGARFVLIKRTDSTGDWYCWDSSRGIVSGNDSYLVLNSTAAEVTNTDWVDTYSAGFELSNAAGNNVNINGASYIFLSVA